MTFASQRQQPNVASVVRKDAGRATLEVSIPARWWALHGKQCSPHSREIAQALPHQLLQLLQLVQLAPVGIANLWSGGRGAAECGRLGRACAGTSTEKCRCASSNLQQRQPSPVLACCTRLCIRYLKFFIWPRRSLRAAWCRRMLWGGKGGGRRCLQSCVSSCMSGK